MVSADIAKPNCPAREAQKKHDGDDHPAWRLRLPLRIVRQSSRTRDDEDRRWAFAVRRPPLGVQVHAVRFAVG